MRYIALIAGILLIAIAIFIGYRLKKLQKEHPYEGMDEGIFYGYEKNYLSPAVMMLMIPGIILLGFSIWRIVEDVK